MTESHIDIHVQWTIFTKLIIPILPHTVFYSYSTSYKRKIFISSAHKKKSIAGNIS